MNRSVIGYGVIVMAFTFAPALCMIDSLAVDVQESDDWKYLLIADIAAGASKKVISFLQQLAALPKPPCLKSIVTDQGKTLLILAVQKSLYEVAVRILVCVSPDDRVTYLNQKDDYGHTAEYYAHAGEHNALIEILKYYVSVDKKDALLDMTAVRFAVAMDKSALDTVKEEIIEKEDSDV
jgi:hypothetical protein